MNIKPVVSLYHYQVSEHSPSSRPLFLGHLGITRLAHTKEKPQAWQHVQKHNQAVANSRQKSCEFTLNSGGGWRRSNLSSATVSEHMLDKEAFVHANVGFGAVI